MLAFVNDFQVALAAQLDESDTALPLDPADAARLDFSGGREYLLTLTDSPALSTRTKMEIVRLSSGLLLQRGVEGTTPQIWPAGSWVMCSITAGGLMEMAAASGGAGGGVTVSPAPPATPPAAAGLAWLYVNGTQCALYCSTGTDSLYDWAQVWPSAYGNVMTVNPVENMSVTPGLADTLIVDPADPWSSVTVQINAPPTIPQRGWRLVINSRDYGVTNYYPLALPGSPDITDLEVFIATDRWYGIDFSEGPGGLPTLELWDGLQRPTAIEVRPASQEGKIYEIHVSSLRGDQERWQPVVQG